MADFPANLRYSVEHEWVDDATPATVGVTSVAADALGDVVYLELPAIDDPAVVNSEPFGAGWLFKVEVTGAGQLLSAEEYAQHAG
jgi:glycine cleavage system H protein